MAALLQQLHDAVPALPVLADHAIDTALVALQGRHRGPLSRRVPHRGGIGVVAPQGLEVLAAGDEPAHPHARHAVGLGNTAGHDQVVQIDVAVEDAGGFHLVQDQAVVDLVADHGDPPPGGGLADGLQRRGGIDGAGGVAGGVEDDGAGPGTHGVDHFLGIHLVALLGSGDDAPHAAAGQPDQWLEEHEAGLDDDHLPPRRGQAGHRQEDGLPGSGGFQQVLLHQFPAADFSIDFRQGRKQLGKAGIQGVVGLVLAQGLHVGLDDVRGRGEIGLPDGEVDDVLHGGRQVEHAANSRNRQRRQRGIPLKGWSHGWKVVSWFWVGRRPSLPIGLRLGFPSDRLAFAPHRISLRHAARLLRFLLKGRVIVEPLEGAWSSGPPQNAPSRSSSRAFLEWGCCSRFGPGLDGLPWEMRVWPGEVGKSQEGFFPVRVPVSDPSRSPRCGPSSRTIPGPRSRHEPARLPAARSHRWGKSLKANRKREPVV